ncbi:MAG: ATP-binding protein [Prevotella sp.]|nr:ATP-binding protein [Prevotella sp.]
MNGSKYKFPIGIQTFSEIREGGYLYVDKTGYVHRLAHQFKFVFLSRPRRFGKSLLLSTMRSYFEGRRDLFEGLEAGRLETEWVQYPVLHISLASVKGGTLENLNEMGGLQLRLLEDKYGIERTENGLGARLQALITGCAKKYGKKVVVLVDEYDAPLLSLMHKPEQLDEMRLALRAFYSPLKDCDEWLRFVFITGISKFSQLSIFSELNNLKRITMVPEYSAICGITEQELHEQWGDAVTEMAADIGITTEEAYRQLKECYDGYHFSEDLTDVYNPFSLLNALVDRRIKDHWFETGTPTVLVNMLQKFNTDITRLGGSMATSEEFDAPTEKMQSVLPLFYQSGYLTIKGYDRDTDTYTLGYPNNEVYQGMMRALAPYYVWDDTLATTNSIVEMYRDLRAGDLDGMLQRLKVFLSSIPYAEGANTEGHFRQLLYVVFSLMGRYLLTEVRTAIGRIDVVWQSRTDIYVFELKMDQPAQKALEQIDEKGYMIPFTYDGRQLHKIGLSFSTKTRTIEEWVIAPMD